MSREAVRHLAKVDKALARYIKKIGPLALKIKKAPSPFAGLLESIVYQQLSGKAAATIWGRFLELFAGKKWPGPEDILAMPEKKMRAAGLSRGKIKAMKDLAKKTLEGLVPTSRQIARLSDAEIVERLTAVHGIGRWTAEMLLIFRLGRGDVLPSTDYGVRKGFMTVYKLADLPSPDEIEEFGERWKPHRTAAAWYLWRALELKSVSK